MSQLHRKMPASKKKGGGSKKSTKKRGKSSKKRGGSAKKKRASNLSPATKKLVKNLQQEHASVLISKLPKAQRVIALAHIASIASSGEGGKAMTSIRSTNKKLKEKGAGKRAASAKVLLRSEIMKGEGLKIGDPVPEIDEKRLKKYKKSADEKAKKLASSSKTANTTNKSQFKKELGFVGLAQKGQVDGYQKEIERIRKEPAGRIVSAKKNKGGTGKKKGGPGKKKVKGGKKPKKEEDEEEDEDDGAGEWTLED